MPQTWEDPGHKNDECGGVYGDNDPVDVVEISSKTMEMGGVYEVKCIGTYAMIDDGELDWKVIAINTGDPLADKINDVEDVERCAAASRSCAAATCTWLSLFRWRLISAGMHCCFAAVHCGSAQSLIISAAKRLLHKQFRVQRNARRAREGYGVVPRLQDARRQATECIRL